MQGRRHASKPASAASRPVRAPRVDRAAWPTPFARSGRRSPSSSRPCAASPSRICPRRCSTSSCGAPELAGRRRVLRPPRRLGGAARGGGRGRPRPCRGGRGRGGAAACSPPRSRERPLRAAARGCSSSAAAWPCPAWWPPGRAPRCWPRTAPRTRSPSPPTGSRSTRWRPTSRMWTGRAHGDALAARGPWDVVLAADVLYTRANVEAALAPAPAPAGAGRRDPPRRSRAGGRARLPRRHARHLPRADAARGRRGAARPAAPALSASGAGARPAPSAARRPRRSSPGPASARTPRGRRATRRRRWSTRPCRGCAP